jgi:hypothetical protein
MEGVQGCHWVIESDYQLTQLHIPEEQNLQFYICNGNFLNESTSVTSPTRKSELFCVAE